MKKRVLIKLGGSSLENANTLTELTLLVSGYRENNYDVILVHGGGPAINQALTARRIEWKFINGQRQTTLEMMDVIEDVLARQINEQLVLKLNQANISAVGLSGAQDKILFCTQSDAELMQVGKIENVNSRGIVKYLTQPNSVVPVIAPIGIGANFEKYNINADWAATKIAMALNVEKLIFLTDQNGILDENSQLIQMTSPEKIKALIEGGVITGGMYTKVTTMMTALYSGIEQVCVLNANRASQLLINQSIGTLLVDDESYTQKEVSSCNKNLI